MPFCLEASGPSGRSWFKMEAGTGEVPGEFMEAGTGEVPGEFVEAGTGEVPGDLKEALLVRVTILGLLIGAVLGTSLPIFAQQPPAAPSPVLIAPGQGIAGVMIGRSVRSAITRLGAPAEVRSVRDGTLHLFNRFGLTVYADGDTIMAVSTTNSLFRTLEGVAMGTSDDEVRRIYGPQFTSAVVEGLPGLAYDHLGLAFGFERGSVAVILVYAPRTEASAGFISLPNVENLKPFSEETQFMSLPGYLRHLVYQQSGIWLSYKEAGRIIREQALVRG